MVVCEFLTLLESELGRTVKRSGNIASCWENINITKKLIHYYVLTPHIPVVDS